jgi:hypothetical protein
LGNSFVALHSQPLSGASSSWDYGKKLYIMSYWFFGYPTNHQQNLAGRKEWLKGGGNGWEHNGGYKQKTEYM